MTDERFEAETREAFQDLCNKPEHAMKEGPLNTLLIGNRQFAWGVAANWAYQKGIERAIEVVESLSKPMSYDDIAKQLRALLEKGEK